MSQGPQKKREYSAKEIAEITTIRERTALAAIDRNQAIRVPADNPGEIGPVHFDQNYQAQTAIEHQFDIKIQEEARNYIKKIQNIIRRAKKEKKLSKSQELFTEAQTLIKYFKDFLVENNLLTEEPEKKEEE